VEIIPGDRFGARPAARLWRVVLAFAACLPAAAQSRALGPFGGPAAVVQTDSGPSKTVLAGTSNALLFRSTDAGESWTPLAFPLQLRAVLHALVIHPGIRDLFLAGISPQRAGASGMWRTSDNGSTWQPVPAFEGLQVRSIAVFRGDPLQMAAGTDMGVFATADGGLTWSRISPPENGELQPVVSIAFDSKDSRVLYAGTPHLPWKTVDGGASWRSIHVGMIDDSDIFSIVIDRNRAQRVFAAACSGIYRSLNGGGIWAKMPQSKDASYRTYTVAQDPQYENVLFAGTTHGMIKSRDGGATWQRIAPYATRSIAFDMNKLGRIYIATDDAGIVRSEDNGRTWRRANAGFSNRRLSPMAMDETGAVYTSGTLDDDSEFFVLPNGSNEWSRGKIPARGVTMLTPSQRIHGVLYAATERALLVSRNAGKSWTTASTPRHEAPLSALLAAPWGSDAMMAAAGSSVFISGDFGSWTERQFPGVIRSLARLDPPWVAAVADSGIFVSIDGDAWEPYARVGAGEEIYGLVASRARFFVATTAGLKASDQARSLRLLPGLPEGNTVQAICRHPARASMLFAASYGSIFASADGGRTWRKVATDGLPIDSVKQLMVAPGTPDRLLVLTRQLGVYALPLDPEAGARTALIDQETAK
jgi:photosystem II stability/assembly factor-like uncharacterized protein